MLSAIATAAQPEHLRLCQVTASGEDLSRLAALTELKSLSLSGGEDGDGLPLLSGLPAFERLEAIDLSTDYGCSSYGSQIGDDDFRAFVILCLIIKSVGS